MSRLPANPLIWWARWFGTRRAFTGPMTESQVPLPEAAPVDEHEELERVHRRRVDVVGRFAAGYAHAMATPIQSVAHSVDFLGGAIHDLLSLVERQRRLLEEAGGRAFVAGEELLARVELDTLASEAQSAVSLANEGVEQVVDTLELARGFNRRGPPRAADVNEALRAALIAARKCRDVADLETDLDPLPRVYCYPTDLRHVFLDLIVDATRTVAGDDLDHGAVSISTRDEGQWVSITFTGTGQRRSAAPVDLSVAADMDGVERRMALARRIVHRHRGTIDVTRGPGARFEVRIRLPVQG